MVFPASSLRRGRQNHPFEACCYITTRFRSREHSRAAFRANAAIVACEVISTDRAFARTAQSPPTCRVTEVNQPTEGQTGRYHRNHDIWNYDPVRRLARADIYRHNLAAIRCRCDDSLRSRRLLARDNDHFARIRIHFQAAYRKSIVEGQSKVIAPNPNATTAAQSSSDRTAEKVNRPRLMRLFGGSPRSACRIRGIAPCWHEGHNRSSDTFQQQRA